MHSVHDSDFELVEAKQNTNEKRINIEKIYSFNKNSNCSVPYPKKRMSVF